MGNISFSKILDPLGLFSKDDDKKEEPKEPEQTAKVDPIDQAQVDFNRAQLEAKARRTRVDAQKPLKRATTGLRVSLSSEPRNVGVKVK